MIQDFDLTLAAGEQLTRTIKGKLVVVKSCTAAFKLRSNNMSERTLNAGDRFGNENQKNFFNSLNFRNDSGASNTISYIVADEPVEIAPVINSVVNTVGTAITNSLASCIAATPTQLLKTTTTAASPAVVAAVATYFRKAIIYAVKTLAGAVNTSDVNIGFSGTASQQPIVIPPGGEYVLEPPNGAKWNLADLYLTVATNGDGIVVLYT